MIVAPNNTFSDIELLELEIDFLIKTNRILRARGKEDAVEKNVMRLKEINARLSELESQIKRKKFRLVTAENLSSF